jgi:hypothetical protein
LLSFENEPSLLSKVPSRSDTYSVLSGNLRHRLWPSHFDPEAQTGAGRAIYSIASSSTSNTSVAPPGIGPDPASP